MHTPEALLEIHALTHRSLDKLFRHCAQLSADELARELPGFGFPSVQRQLFHIVNCEDWWAGGVSGESQALALWQDYPHLPLLEAYRAQVAAMTRGYLQRVSPEELNTPRQFTSGEHRGEVE